MVAESRRNPAIAKTMQDFDKEVRAHLVAMLQAAAQRGDIRADVDFDAVATMLMIMADGVWWRRAVEPNFNAEEGLPLFMELIQHMLMGGGSLEKKKTGGSQS